MSARLTYRIPTEDLEEFYRLRAGEQERILALLDVLCQIDHAPTISKAATRLAKKYRHKGWGFSRSTFMRYHKAYRSNRDWRCLVRNYRSGKQGLPPAFVQYWQALCERNQRKCKPAYRALIRQWHQWAAGDVDAAIPGYRTPPPADRSTDHPSGWSYSTLIRHAPDPARLAAARIGRAAAAEHLPAVFTSRVGLEVGQYYLFDDMWHDHKVSLLGQRQALRPLEFHCLDLFSGCKIKWGMKPQTVDEITGKRENLKEREMLILVCAVLTECGYRPEGTSLVVEHGTAAIREDLERQLYDLTGGAVTVARSGIQVTEAFSGQYAGAGKGNYKFKAALESLGNLIHNEMAFLPGQVGKDRDHSPAELYGREKHANALLRAMAALPVDVAQRLRLPVLDFHTFEQIAFQIYTQINQRTDHNLEGWEQAGLVANEWRLADGQPWLPIERMADLDEQTRAIALRLIEMPGYLRSRKLSPAEVWQSRSGSLRRFPQAAAAQLLAKHYGKERRVNAQRLIEFEDADAGPGIHRFLAEIVDQSGRRVLLEAGEKFLCVLNPLAADELALIDAHGRYVGSAPRWGAAARDNMDALHRQIGQVARIESAMLKPVALRGSEILRQRIDDSRHNAQVLGASVDTLDAPENVRKQKQRIAAAEHKATKDHDFSVDAFAAIAGDENERTTEVEDDFDIAALYDGDAPY